jgi:cytochrome bd-type quinol oxidase subunit 2
MATSPPQTTTDARAGSTGRRIHLYLMALFLVGVVVQFYFAGRGAFEAASYGTHKDFGYMLHTLSVFILIVTIAIPATRNRVDIGLAFALAVLTTLQAILGAANNHDVAALHPVNALLVLGAAAGMFSRDRRLLGGARPAAA